MQKKGTISRIVVVYFSLLLSSCQSLTSSGQLVDYLALSYYPSFQQINEISHQTSQSEIDFIYHVLSYTAEIHIHQMNGEVFNTVYISEDGKEAVFDNKGNLVTQCENMGSYNYAYFNKEPLKHFTLDILPWLMWGNCPEDTTTIEQRANAYINDFNLGYIKSRNHRRKQGIRLINKEQKLAIAFIISALGKSNYNLEGFLSVSEAYQTEPNQTEPDQTQTNELLYALNQGIVELIKSNTSNPK